MEITVIKRDGNVEPLDFTQIKKQTVPATDGLKNIRAEDIELNAKISFTSKMTSEDIQLNLEIAARNLIDLDRPDATYAAARLHLYNMYHKVKRVYFNRKISGDVYKAISLKDYFHHNAHKLSYAPIIDKFDLDELGALIDSKRDLLFNYLGIVSLGERYLMRTNNEIVELPQHAFMSLAMFAAQNEDDPTHWAGVFYETLSKLKFLPGTPTLSNGRTINGNCFSCAVGTMPDDLKGIFDAFKTMAVGSKNGTGWGYDITRLRASGSTIDGHPGVAHGPIPFLKIINDICIAVDQLGVRLGAIKVSMETWHLGIFDFLDLKKKGGGEKQRAEELMIGVSCSDIFMERIKTDKDWILFDPYDTPILANTYGETFRKAYLSLEKRFETDPKSFISKPVRIKAKDLWKKIQSYAYDVGQPFIFFKDNANGEPNTLDYDPNEEGYIRSGNLCEEYLAPIKNDDDITTCNLGSVNIANCIDDEDFYDTCATGTRFLDNIVDITTYKIPNTEQLEKDRRSIGLGLCGEAEVLAKSKIVYGSFEHLNWVDHVYEIYKRASDETSLYLGEVRGPCKASRKGYRNLFRRCIAPTSSIAVIMGTTAGVEAVYGRQYIEDNKMGNFKTVAPDISSETYGYYITAYEVPQLDAIAATAKRQEYVDMGISHSIYLVPEDVTGKSVFDLYMTAWKLGMKTIYYVRSKSKKKLDENVVKEQIKCEGCEG